MLQNNTAVHKPSEVRNILEEYDALVTQFRIDGLEEGEAKEAALSIQKDKYKERQVENE